MSFVSYAQNYEDVMLWRVLRGIKDGFYIDVGANDPEIDSVTKAFYDRGWSGINIEPLSAHYAALSEQRPRDINLECAAGSQEGEFQIWEGAVRGWATMDPSVVEHHLRNGHAGSWKAVSVRPLRSICAEYVHKDVHFLKVDVEGAELSVLSSMDFETVRPWIVIVEALFPNTADENYSEWEHLLLSARYNFVYADGVNRFYVANEHPELNAGFRYPPNVLDEFITRGYEVAGERIKELGEVAGRVKELEELARAEAGRANKLEERVRTEAGRAENAERQLVDARSALSSMESSISWRVTRPFRWVSHKIRRCT